MDDDWAASIRQVLGLLRDSRDGVCTAAAAAEATPANAGALVEALTALRELREWIAEWEPELISAARAAGVSWAQLAPALGVASRQAAERRYLRRHTTGGGETTGEQRVRAARDQRAGDRAVTDWARANAAELRQLAGQVSGLADLDPDAREQADKVHAALAGQDAATLLEPLSQVREHLVAEHPALADRIDAAATDMQVQRDAVLRQRRSRGESRPE